MREIVVNASKKYSIFIEQGLLENAGRYVSEFKRVQRVCVVSDDRVFALYGEKCQKSLENCGFEVCFYVFENGEKSKNANTLLKLLSFLAENKLTRTDMLIALGGGVVGDLCGFASAIYLRGVDFIQIPTTLLAMVDSSVGGKTAIDIPEGKNLVGAFHQPRLVLCDPLVLATLDEDTFRDGCAEVIKYGVILDNDFYNALKTPLSKESEYLEEAIYRSVSIKRDVVEEDEFDTGKRQLLNFGHTLGHSIEKLSDFTLTHGACVAKGMYLAAKLSADLGFEDNTESIEKILVDYGFDLSCPFSGREIAEGALSDKKRAGAFITAVLVQEIGKCTLFKMSTDDFCKAVEKLV